MLKYSFRPKKIPPHADLQTLINTVNENTLRQNEEIRRVLDSVYADLTKTRSEQQ